MHILDEHRPCEYIRPGGKPCGRPAKRVYEGQPRCTLCQAEAQRGKAPGFVEKADAPTWEPRHV